MLEQGIFTLCSIESSVHEMREEGGWHGHSSTLMHLLPGPEEESVGRVERHPQKLAQPLGLALSTVSARVMAENYTRVYEQVRASNTKIPGMQKHSLLDQERRNTHEEIPSTRSV